MISLLIIIYAAFISLGLPDAMLGSGWPVIRLEFNAPLGYAGFVSIVITAGTIISSLVSSRLLKRFGCGKVTLVSVAMTAAALFGFSVSPSFPWFLIFALPLGLGGGAVDSGLNEFVAEHYKASHMNFLHCFWGIGALASPLIMSAILTYTGVWRNGYRTVGAIQIILVVILFFSLPLWKKVVDSKQSVDEKVDQIEQSGNTENTGNTCNTEKPSNASGTDNTVQTGKRSFGQRLLGLFSPLKIQGIKPVLLGFFAYCGVEATMGLWGASYLVEYKGFDKATAAAWVSLFYVGITVGRLICGFIAMKITNKWLIRVGEYSIFLGVLCMLLPLPNIFTLIGFILVGTGCAPIYPAMLHETPARFGKTDAQAVMGFQMAVAYTGSTLLPPSFGWIAGATTTRLLPFFVITWAVIMMFCTEKSNRVHHTR